MNDTTRAPGGAQEQEHAGLFHGWARKDARAYLKRESRKWPNHLEEVPREQWPDNAFALSAASRCPVENVYRSNRYLVTEYIEDFGKAHRLTICRTEVKRGTAEWEDGLTWDEIWKIKSELGYDDWYGVEVYPRKRDLVNVANMRHLWLFAEPLAVGWFAATEVQP